MKKNILKTGFTLIEMLIVMAVVSILIAIIIPSYRGMQNDAWMAKAEKEVQTLQVAIESYYRHNNKFPATLADLTTAKPMIVSQLLEDPWKSGADIENTTKKTYGYLQGELTGFGPYYVVYSYGSDFSKTTVLPGETGFTAYPIEVKEDDIVASNIPVRKNQ